ncbi:hypothetical protein KAR91_61580 [Candidatus Pacearchaeota archaeon]|nr:hypothetical protein [Candidatus Pacearchaeota archaeon]
MKKEFKKGADTGFKDFLGRPILIGSLGVYVRSPWRNARLMTYGKVVGYSKSRLLLDRIADDGRKTYIMASPCLDTIMPGYFTILKAYRKEKTV